MSCCWPLVPNSHDQSCPKYPADGVFEKCTCGAVERFAAEIAEMRKNREDTEKEKEEKQ
jgi:hypothetical protein